MPPALVAMLPPIWQLPSDGRLSGNRRLTPVGRGLRFGERQARLNCHRVAGRLDRAHALEPTDATAGSRPASGSARRRARYCRPAARPGMPRSFASARICDTCSRRAGPQHDGRAPLVHVAPLAQIGRAAASGSVSACSGPTMARNRAMRSRWTRGVTLMRALAARCSRSLIASPRPVLRDRHDGNGRGARSIERAQGGKQVGCGLGKIAGRR